MRSCRRWLLPILLAAVAFGAGFAAHAYLEEQRPHFSPDTARLEGYSVSADGTVLTLYGSIGAGDQLDVPVVSEETGRVVVRVPSWRFVPAAGGFKNAAAYMVQSRVTVRDPLGDRTVVDATTGQPLRRTVQP